MKAFLGNFTSLREYKCPKWFRNAKFGIWSHWGPQSVPMAGDWYARNMYIQGTPQYNYHLRHYGHPSRFGYKDICAMWKAEKFDPDELMELYVKAGARYFVGQAMHHDHFFNYPSSLNHFNAAAVGPRKDIVGLWKAAAEKRGLPFGLTEHMGATFSWWGVNKWCDYTGPFAGVPYDGNDPNYRNFYLDNKEHIPLDRENTRIRPWYTLNEKYHDYWLAVMKEIIDMYQPDLLYSDGGLPFGERGISDAEDVKFANGLEAVAYLYNKSVSKHGENLAVYNQKDIRPEIFRIGVLDIEKSQLTGICEEPWQTDTCIGNWFYDARQEFKKPGHIIEILIDIISKNGNMLLNILQKPDGTIDTETRFILEELASWFSVCGEGVYDSRPWRKFGEGSNRVSIEGFKETKVEWNSSDFRFTVKGEILYAFMPRVPENHVAVVKSLEEDEQVVSVKLLGGSELPFQQAFGILTVQLPKIMPTKYANCMAIKIGKVRRKQISS
ncbi:MAG TPA: alpha-L-fucosidase [Prolixibacteraceae bacterium]|nr:alpha-L-fucosidase [Prolixibacteraceae bacterium]